MFGQSSKEILARVFRKTKCISNDKMKQMYDSVAFRWCGFDMVAINKTPQQVDIDYKKGSNKDSTDAMKIYFGPERR